MSHVNSPNYVTIETTSFSGATLLTLLLSAHPEIATVAEMSGLIDSVDPDEYLCSCGKKIKCCNFWQALKVGMQENARKVFLDEAWKLKESVVSKVKSILTAAEQAKKVKPLKELKERAKKLKEMMDKKIEEISFKKQ